MEVLARAKAQGKIRFIGLSNTNPEEYQKAIEVSRVDVIQGQYNYLYPDLNSMQEIIQNDNLGCMSWGSFHKGVLTGAVHKTREYESSDCRKKSPWWKRKDINKDIDSFEPMMHKLKDLGIELDSFALGYILNQEWISTALVGMRNIEYLEKTINALTKLPPKEVTDELTAN